MNNFVAIFQLIHHLNLKVLVPTPPKLIGYYVGYGQEFSSLMMYELLNHETKYHLLRSFIVHPLATLLVLSVSVSDLQASD